MSTDDWCTPPVVADPLEQFFGGPVDVDPCSNARSIIRAVKAYRAGGLHLPWGKTSYENPPFSRLDLWTDKGIYELEVARNVRELVRLVPVATSTGWWRRAFGLEPVTSYEGFVVDGAFRVPPKPVALFTKRIAFLDESGNSTAGVARFDVALLYYGPRSRHEAFRREFKTITSWEARC